MRFPSRLLLPLLCLALCLAGASTAVEGQDGNSGTGPLRFVCIDRVQRAVAVEPLRTTSSSLSLADLVQDREITHCWSWSDVCPPRKIAADGDPAVAAECESARRLSVRVAGQSASPADTPAEPKEKELAVVAAPEEMWREVPRSLLPTTTAARSAAFSLPRTDGRWRLQAHAGDRASTWQAVADHEPSVTLTLLPAEHFRFLVTADGAPLQDARFHLVEPEASGPAARLRGFEVSDTEGLVTLTLPTSEASAVIVTHDSRAAAPYRRFRDTPPSVELGQGLTVVGRAVDEDGEPVASARLLGTSFIPGGSGLMQRHRGRTAPDGLFAVSGFSPGQASLQVDEDDLAFASTFDLERSLDLGLVVLKAPEVVWVRVVDSRDEAPVTGARIRDASGYWTAADDDGLAHLPTDFGRGIGVKANGYLLARFELPLQSGTREEAPFIVRLEPAFSVSGVFVAADGNTPATAGRATALGLEGGLGMSAGIGHDGSFSLDLAGGAYDLELTAGDAGFRRLEVRGVAGESRDLGFVAARPSAWAWGYLLGEDDYQPVSGASVSYTRPSRFGPLLAPALGRVSTVTTNAEGYFEINGLELGTATLRIQADGFAPRNLRVEAPAIQGVDVGVVELSRGRRVTVRSDVAEGLVLLDSGRTGLPRDRFTAKLANGQADFAAMPEAPFDVLVQEDGVPVCETGEEAAEEDVIVTCNHSATRVTGLVSRGDRPGDGMLVWRRQGEAQLPEGAIRHGAGPFTRTEELSSTQNLELSAPIGSDGRYRLAAVLPGEWEVVQAPLSGGVQEARTVTVPRGREAVLDFRYDGVTIEGLVLDQEGQPAPRASVTVFPGRRTVGTDESGRFEFLGLQPGTHQLRARLGHLRSSLIDAQLRDSGDREFVQLTLGDDPSASELEIVLAGADSGFCFVEMDSALPKIVQVEAGVARVTPDPPLPRRLRVACQTEGRWILDGWSDLRTALDRGMEFDPADSTAAIALVGAASPERAEVVGPGGWDLGRLRLWFDGSPAFSVGETIPNLPEGEYGIRFRNRTRSVWVDGRRTTVVDVDEF